MNIAANFAARLTRIMMCAALVITPLTGCAEKTMDLQVVVYNYWPRAIADVSVNGQYAGGSYGSYGIDGTGGKITCCVKVKTGSMTVDWTLDGPENSPRLGERIHAQASLASVPSDAEFLAVHIYPDQTVVLEATRQLADSRPSKGAAQ
ncbi:hypothetical protein ACTJLC_21570 [Paraburkholderia sp. 22099]|jgi:hypothetical protein|uniref:DUF3304 domain-containing protein n=1 Tax=Paraburkholderia terricola TaxID=169427 RepID=A0ABU1LYY9_9BURK|nr:hypothetical protein [Paraburkholderia terricola]MDR6411972.1 hypothetical protein [Paraburkholderia terricola]MDR6484540.1 hypothetical protein [Paraburkholderia terricola]MDR6491407.1 hypothetical protein [Paraburkholderia terricola]